MYTYTYRWYYHYYYRLDNQPPVVPEDTLMKMLGDTFEINKKTLTDLEGIENASNQSKRTWYDR